VLRVSYIIAGRDVISTRRGEWKDVLPRIFGDYGRGIDSTTRFSRSVELYAVSYAAGHNFTIHPRKMQEH